MKVFVVFAHPEPKSLNGSLLQIMVQELESQGHEVRVSDLYAMQWKPQVDRADFLQATADERLRVTMSSAIATASGQLTDDVKAEQEKMLWADTVILQFPLWWYSMPAILKGWVERVYSLGFGYGVGDHNDKHWGDRYGEGKMKGKRAMLVATIGGREEQYRARAVSGSLEDLLFHINHGMLFYIGFDVLPPYAVYNADRLDNSGFLAAAEGLRERLRTLPVTKPIPYRPQNGGDYEIPSLALKPGLEGASCGFAMHVRNTEDTEES